MINKYEVTIGIENHVQLKTKMKMFSTAPVTFKAAPNEAVAAMDVGFPGAMPIVNKKAVQLALILAYTLKMKISKTLTFDRKNYYYSDLSKGFQITQHFNPIAVNGQLNISKINQEQPQIINITQIQIEEDTAQQNHNNNYTQLNYNRSGIPLIEVISEPEIHDADTAVLYLNALKQLFQFLNVSDGDMSRGSFRCDINISLALPGQKLGNRVEIKNLNSLNNVHKAINYEIKRQSELLDNGQKIELSTRRFDEASQTTILMRKKETNVDYRFHTEPNIGPIQITKSLITKATANIPMLPREAYKWLTNTLNIDKNAALDLIKQVDLFNFFKMAIKNTQHFKKVAAYCLGEITAHLNKTQKKLNSIPLKPEHLSEIIELTVNDKISSKQAKLILQELLIKKITPHEVIKNKKLIYLSDPKAIAEIVDVVFNASAAIINANKDRHERLQKMLMGKIMAMTKGNCSPIIAQKLIAEKLKNYFS